MKLLTEKDAEEIARLEKRLLGFYNTFTDYPAFAQPSEHLSLWETVLALAEEIAERRKESNPGLPSPCRILEIGAGRSGFGPFLRSRAEGPVHLTSQDITRSNLEYLEASSDAVLTEAVETLPDATEPWDIIFHSYVYEHVCRPWQFNAAAWKRLRTGGALVIQSPRYDFPFYLPPSFDHLSRARKIGFSLGLLARDAFRCLGAQAGFEIFSDPAVFHLPFHRDRDAVHRVRKAALLRFFKNRAVCSEFEVPAFSWKDYLVKEFLTLRVVLRKTD